MYCLWNGEYGEHDLSYIGGLQGILELQKEHYANDVGMVVGDFTCLEVEYDWGRKDQRWKCECNLCGKIIYQYHTQDWRKWKGRKIYCDCRRVTREKERIAEKELAKSALQEKIDSVVGTTYENWKITEYTGFVYCVVECAECGNQKRVDIKQIRDRKLLPCDHRIQNDYSNPKWQGVRIGHLVSVRQDGPYYIVKCDCGRERRVRSHRFFTARDFVDCGNPECAYSSNVAKEARKRRNKGVDYEDNVIQQLEKCGFTAEKVGPFRDYGVDVIAENNEFGKIAIQCKNTRGPATVEAIQECYAGGRFYGVEKFACMSSAGFTLNAQRMAKVLGVYLWDGGEFNYPENMQAYSNSILPLYSDRVEAMKKYYEIDGVKKTLGDWCYEYGVEKWEVRKLMGGGLALKNALEGAKNGFGRKKKYSIDGFSGTMTEIGARYNMNPATIAYRMKQCGMTLEEAVKTPLNKNGRKKSSVSN